MNCDPKFKPINRDGKQEQCKCHVKNKRINNNFRMWLRAMKPGTSK